jgi:hypothetical protein
MKPQNIRNTLILSAFCTFSSFSFASSLGSEALLRIKNGAPTKAEHIFTTNKLVQLAEGQQEDQKKTKFFQILIPALRGATASVHPSGFIQLETASKKVVSSFAVVMDMRALGFTAEESKEMQKDLTKDILAKISNAYPNAALLKKYLVLEFYQKNTDDGISIVAEVVALDFEELIKKDVDSQFLGLVAQGIYPDTEAARKVFEDMQTPKVRQSHQQQHNLLKAADFDAEKYAQILEVIKGLQRQYPLQAPQQRPAPKKNAAPKKVNPSFSA